MHDEATIPAPSTGCTRSCADCPCLRMHDEPSLTVRTGRALVRWVESVAHAAALPSAA